VERESLKSAGAAKFLQYHSLSIKLVFGCNSYLNCRKLSIEGRVNLVSRYVLFISFGCSKLCEF